MPLGENPPREKLDARNPSIRQLCAPGGDAICLVGLDSAVPDRVIAAVRKLPLVKQATPLAF